MRNLSLLGLLCFLAISPLNAQVLKVAILDFENTSGIPKYDGLGKAMSSMLITDIEANVSPKRLQLVERSQIQKILKEQNFQASAAVDKNSTVKAGKILGVKYLLLGDIYVLNDALIINARFVDAETGDIKFSKKQEGKLPAWLSLKTNIAKELAASIAMPFTSPSIPDKDIPPVTLTTFANAVKAKDENNVEKAEEYLGIVKEMNPGFKYTEDVQIQLEEIKKSLQNIQKTTDEINKKQDIVLSEINKMQSVNDELLKSLNPKKITLSNELKIKINAQLSDKDYKKYSDLIIEPFSSFEKMELLKTGDDNYYENLKQIRVDVALKYPNTDIGYFSRSYLEELRGNTTEAVALNDSATAVNPVFWLAYWKNGKILNDVEYYNKAVKANPQQSLIARELRGLYYQNQGGPNIAFRVNQAKIDFQECFRLTGQVFYKFMECGLYYDNKIWSELCPIVNSAYGEQIKNLSQFKENPKLYQPFFAICDKDTSICQFENIQINKPDYDGKKVILHLTYRGINEYNSYKRKDQYYFSIKAGIKQSKITDYDFVSAIPVELYLNRHVFEKEIGRIKDLKEGDLITAIVDVNTSDYNIILDVVAIEYGFTSFFKMQYPQKPIHEYGGKGIVVDSRLGENFINCLNETYTNTNMKAGKCINTIGGLEKVYTYYSDFSLLLNNVAWNTAEKSTDKTELQWALKMIERANYIEFETSHNYLDTYAFVLVKNGRKQEAVEKLNKAVELARKAGDEDAVKSYQQKLAEL